MSKKTRAIIVGVVLLVLTFGAGILHQTSEAAGVPLWLQKSLPWVAGVFIALFLAGIFWFGKSRKKW